MTFIEAYEKIRAAMEKSNPAEIEGHLAIQVNLNDEDAQGIMYIEVKDGQLFVEPYDYYDHDAILTASYKDVVRVMGGRLGYDKAVENGVFTVDGDLEKAAELKKLVVKATRKPCAKKEDCKAEEKPAKKTKCKKNA
ncbi:MAG: SCP2 sterol-binding domain-containing protein [Clostridia bacterium]|nr:SCP2 sterol-binding domain-containing protein [Clostridia bacterium]